jgi:hypothetical protein
MDRRYTVLDPATLVESPLLTASALTEFDVSPDGRHLVLATYSEDSSNPARRFAFIDRRTGAMESSSFDAPLPLGSFQRSIPVYWRPGHEEAWIVGGDRIFIWRPGSAIAEMQTGLVYFPPSVDDPEPSLFTRDGAHFFVFGPEGDNLANQFLPVYLASADDPLGPRLRLNAPGTALDEVRSLPDGRLLIRTWTTLPQRGDIHLVDPVLGTIRAVASAGSVTTIGAGRALALLRFVERAGTGDLNLLDLATGAHTLLGENVSFTALDPVGDPLAPGALLAFVVRNRLASPYDGLWLGVLP